MKVPEELEQNVKATKLFHIEDLILSNFEVLNVKLFKRKNQATAFEG